MAEHYPRNTVSVGAWRSECHKETQHPVDELEFLETLAEESTGHNTPDPMSTCHRCGHIHVGMLECETPMGGDRICRCEMEMPA